MEECSTLATPAAYEPVLAWASMETIVTVRVMQVSVDELKMLGESGMFSLYC